MKKIISLLLSALLFLSVIPYSASAAEYPAESSGPIQTTELNELSTRLVVNNYFNQRFSFLKGISNTIDIANAAMVNDETSHRASIQTAGLDLIEYSLTFDSISCWDSVAHVFVTETVVYLNNGQQASESISHEIYVCQDYDGILSVSGDGYKMLASDFESCSYVPPEILAQSEQNAGSGGSGTCIVSVAANEYAIGYTEGANRWTKYGAWYDSVMGTSWNGSDWCAMFVSWCANSASVATSVIPCKSYVPDMKSFFSSSGYYMKSSASGGSYTPKPGDIFFQFGSYSSPTHVGIVEKVANGYVYLIDGNCENKVNYHVFSLTASTIVGYGNVQFTNSSHQYSSTWSYNTARHWHVCTKCGLGVTGIAAHTLTQDMVTGKKYCTICPYGAESHVRKNGFLNIDS